MIRKLLSAMVVGAGVFAAAGFASATDFQINLYGASAQYLFWNDAADNFLSTSLGCTTTGKDQDGDKKNGITEGSGCTGGHTYTFRYSSKASYDGIYAVRGVDLSATVPLPPEVCVGGEPICPPGTGFVPNDATKWSYRKMSQSVASPAATCCAKVNIGASDVAGASFIQKSYGELKGHKLGGYITRDFTGISTAGTVVPPKTPLIVPFGFFANNSVTVTQCVEPRPDQPDVPPIHKALSRTGNLCWDPDNDGKSADCIGLYKCGSDGKCTGGVNKGSNCTKIEQCPDVVLADTSCKRLPIDNMTRSMAALIFGAKAVYWQDFGRYFDGDDNTGTTQDRITACFRHAGSGTHATMDLGLMRGNGWGITLDQTQNTDTALGSTRWFNDGSGDLAKCLHELNGSVGYADCDQLAGQDPITAKKVHALKYQGAECNRYNVRNGVYEFWSKSHLYYKTPSTDEAALFAALFLFAEDPAKIPPTKSQWWAADKEMKVKKATDFNYLLNKAPVGGPYLP